MELLFKKYTTRNGAIKRNFAILTKLHDNAAQVGGSEDKTVACPSDLARIDRVAGERTDYRRNYRIASIKLPKDIMAK